MSKIGNIMKHYKKLKNYTKNTYIARQFFQLHKQPSVMTILTVRRYRIKKLEIINYQDLNITVVRYTNEQITAHLKNWKKAGVCGTITARTIAETFMGLHKYSDRKAYQTAHKKSQRLLDRLFNQGFFSEKIQHSPIQYAF